MKLFNIQIIVYYVEIKGSNSAAGNKTEWLRFELWTSQVSLIKTDHSKLRVELGEINFAGLRISLYFSSWPGKLSPHLLCGSAVFFGRNFYLTFTFSFLPFFFLFSCLFVFLSLLLVLSSGRESHN